MTTSALRSVHRASSPSNSESPATLADVEIVSQRRVVSALDIVLGGTPAETLVTRARRAR